MRRFLLSLAACSLSALVPAQAAGERLTLCFERQEVRPWRSLDHTGLNFDLLAGVARRTGVSFDYQSMPWKRCLEQLKANQVDGAFTVSFKPDRMALGAFPGLVAGAPDPHPNRAMRMHTDSYVLVRPRGSRLDWDGKRFLNLDGRIGFQLGYSVGDFLRAHGVQADEGSQRSDELAQKLVAGRLAGAALGGHTTANLMRGPFASRLEVVPIPLLEQPYYLVFSHALVGRNPRLAARLWEAVEATRTSAAYRQHEASVLAH